MNKTTSAILTLVSLTSWAFAQPLVAWNESFTGSTTPTHLTAFTSRNDSSISYSGGNAIIDGGTAFQYAYLHTTTTSSGVSSFHGNNVFDYRTHNVVATFNLAGFANDGATTGRNTFRFAIMKDATLNTAADSGMDHGISFRIERMNDGAGGTLGVPYFRLTRWLGTGSSAAEAGLSSLSGKPTSISFNIGATSTTITIGGATFTNGSTALTTYYPSQAGQAGFDEHRLVFGAALVNGPNAASQLDNIVTLSDFQVNVLSALDALGLNYATPYTFNTLAGADLPNPSSVDATGSAARFKNPLGVAVDSNGVTYVADTENHIIRKIATDGVVTTLAGTAGVSGSTNATGSAARFNSPFAVAVDTSGHVYVADYGNDTIRKITPAGVVTTLAGLANSPGNANGTGTSARFNGPSGVAVDSSGQVYVADYGNHTIRKITSAGVVTTLAGSSGSQGSLNGTGSAARFASPNGIAVDISGNVYVADMDNHLIRKITSDGVVTTLAGTAASPGSVNGTGAAARFSYPSGITVDTNGDLYVADWNNSVIRKITSTGVVTTLVGTASAIGSTDGTASAARFYKPSGVAVDNSGTVFVADLYNSTIRKITGSGNVTTLAGSAGAVAANDGTGTAARFNSPSGVALDSTGTIYVADARNSTLRKITTSGAVTTLAGNAGSVGTTDDTGSAARFSVPTGVALDSSGNLYVADRESHTIRKITPAGVVTTLAGSAGVLGISDGTGSAARFNYPSAVAVDGSGNVYVADRDSHTIRKITPAGVVTTLAGMACAAEAFDRTGSGARFNKPSSLCIDSSGNLYVADTGNHTIRKITSEGVTTTLAGTPGSRGVTDGTSAAARFDGPISVAVDAAGNVYVADANNKSLRKISSAGVVTTLAGNVLSTGAGDGTGVSARFNRPLAVAVSPSGQLVVADAKIATAAPYLGYNTATSGVFGQAFSGTIFAPGMINNYSAVPLPSGISFSSANGSFSGIASVVGTFPVTISATNVYGQTATQTLSFTVAKADQTISFSALPNKTYGDSSFVLNATASSNLSPTFSIVSGPAILNGSTLYLSGAGIVVVSASEAGNANYNPASPVERSFTVAAGNSLYLNSLAAASVPTHQRAVNDDPDFDGVSNLLEYALGFAPMTPDSSSLPISQLSGGMLNFTYKRAANNVTYSVLTTTNLTNPGSWTATGVNQGSPDANGNTKASIPQSSQKRFLRLQTTLVP